MSAEDSHGACVPFFDFLLEVGGATCVVRGLCWVMFVGSNLLYLK